MEGQRHRIAVVLMATAVAAKRHFRTPLLEVLLRRNELPGLPSLARTYGHAFTCICGGVWASHACKMRISRLKCMGEVRMGEVCQTVDRQV